MGRQEIKGDAIYLPKKKRLKINAGEVVYYDTSKKYITTEVIGDPVGSCAEDAHADDRGVYILQ